MEQALTRVVNNRPTLIELPTVNGTSMRLVPGGNNVPTEYMETVKSNPAVSMYLDLGWIELASAKELSKPEGVEAPRSLREYSLKASEAFVEIETSKKVLKTWAANDSRQEIKDAVSKRMSAISLLGKE